MLDQIESMIAQKLSEQHFYPFAKDNYLNIFNKFSHFPINLGDVGIKGEGKTITYLSLVVLKCFGKKNPEFLDLYNDVLKELKILVSEYFLQDVTVETFLGCILYFYHPSRIKNILSTINISKLFNKEQLYEFELKKKTILIYAL